MLLLKTIFIFILAGICEIGGGYLIWQSIREDKPVWYGVLGGAVLILYGVVATFQMSNFAKVYATYGGFFIVLSLVWAFLFDKYVPSRYDILGTIIVLIGVCIIYYSPRG